MLLDINSREAKYGVTGFEYRWRKNALKIESSGNQYLDILSRELKEIDFDIMLILEELEKNRTKYGSKQYKLCSDISDYYEDLIYSQYDSLRKKREKKSEIQSDLRDFHNNNIKVKND